MKSSQGIRCFRDAVAIITGGASGIGLAIGKAIASEGAIVVLVDKSADDVSIAAKSLSAQSLKVTCVVADVTDYDAIDCVVKETVLTHGRLDYMFNNAGIGVCGLMSDLSIDHWRKVVNVNLMGAVYGINASYPVMLRQGFGHIVNTSSMAGLIPFPLTGCYTATKHALVGLSMALRVEAAGRGVRVSALCPGVIRTPILKAQGDNILLYDVPAEMMDKSWKKTFPMDPDRFAHAVLRQVRRNKPIIIVPGWWKAFWWMNRLSTGLMLRFMKKYFYDVAVKDMAEIGVDLNRLHDD